MRSFDGFDVQVHDAWAPGQKTQHPGREIEQRTFMFADSRISRIRQWTRLTIAQTGDVVFIPTKVLGYGPAGHDRSEILTRGAHLLDFIGTELLVYHGPDNVVALHC